MSIKLGSGTINKIMLGNTLINKVYLGGNIIYPNGTPPPTGDLLDGFNSISGTGPWTSDLEWSDSAGSGFTVSRTTSNVTEGTHTWRIQHSSVPAADNALATGSIFGATTVDLSGYTSLSIDVFGAAIPAGSEMVLAVFDLSDFSSTSFGAGDGVAGSNTLTIDLTILSPRTDCLIIFGVDNLGGENSIESACDMYADNLRAS